MVVNVVKTVVDVLVVVDVTVRPVRVTVESGPFAVVVAVTTCVDVVGFTMQLQALDMREASKVAS